MGGSANPGGFLSGMLGVIGPRLKEKHDESVKLQNQQKEGQFSTVWGSMQNAATRLYELKQKGQLTPEEEQEARTLASQYQWSQQELNKITKGNKPLGEAFQKVGGFVTKLLTSPRGQLQGPQQQGEQQGQSADMMQRTGQPAQSGDMMQRTGATVDAKPMAQSPSPGAKLTGPPPVQPPAQAQPAQQQAPQHQTPAAPQQDGNSIHMTPQQQAMALGSPQYAEQQKLNAQTAQKLDLAKKEGTLALEQSDEEFKGKLKRINDSDMSDDEKRESRLSLYGIKPQVPPSLSRVHVLTEDGWQVAEYNSKTGGYEKLDHTPIAPAKIKDVMTGEPPAENKEDPAEVKGYTQLNLSKGMPLGEARKSALARWDAEQKEKETRAKLAEERARQEKDLKAREVAAVEEQSRIAKENAGKKYEPGGQSLANPTGDTAIETGAWDYIGTGHIPFTGFSSGGKGVANPREKMIARAGELLSDLGLTGADLPAVRGKIKSDTAALSKITSLGASVQQFEETLDRNMDVAKKLSEAWKRSDLQFVNRISAAFKTGTGDAEALNLAAQLHGVAREWGKIMSGSTSAAGVPVSEANADDVLFSKGISNGQLYSLMQNVIAPDVKNRTAAIQEQQDRLITKLRGDIKTTGTGGGPSPNATLTGTNASPKKGDKQNYNGANYAFDGDKWVKQK
jgi:hypothetical protein